MATRRRPDGTLGSVELASGGCLRQEVIDAGLGAIAAAVSGYRGDHNGADAHFRSCKAFAHPPLRYLSMDHARACASPGYTSGGRHFWQSGPPRF